MPIIILKKDAGPPDRELVQKSITRFDWLVGFMICRFKFIHTMLGMMVKKPVNTGTMGVRVTGEGKFELSYNPAWIDSLTDAELTYVFHHEVDHVALHHCTRRALTLDPAEHELANTAHDLAVNELIPECEGCARPKNPDGSAAGIYVSELKKMPDYSDIEERQTAEWYFDYLKTKQKKGKKLPNYIKFDDHGDWHEHDLADEKVRVKISDIDMQNGWGTMSSTYKEMILAAQVRKINWRNYIRNWFGNMAWKDRMTTRKKPNRRTGFIHPGYKRSYTDRWLVVTDTSGSVPDDLLSQFLGVLNQLVETLPIDFAQCDVGITADPHPYDRRKDKVEFHGRGGTDFQPIIDLVDQRHYRGLMILTDGEAGAPTKPKCARVLWVLPPNHNPPVDWGDRVHLQRYV